MTHGHQTGREAESAETAGTPSPHHTARHERLPCPGERGRIASLIDGIQEIPLAEFTAEESKDIIHTLINMIGGTR